MKITKILKVEDTRKIAEVGDKFVRIPGSGEKNACALCGKSHEIHATVELDSKETAIVGVGCAKKSSPVSFKLFELNEKADALYEQMMAFQCRALWKAEKSEEMFGKFNGYGHYFADGYESNGRGINIPVKIKKEMTGTVAVARHLSAEEFAEHKEIRKQWLKLIAKIDEIE